MDFFIIENGQQAGPFSLNQLVEKKISAETLVWAQGMADWTPAWKVDDLKLVLEEIERQKTQTTDRIITQTPPTTPIGTQANSNQQVSTANAYEQQPTGNHEMPFTQQEPLREKPKKKKMLKYLWKLVALLLVVVFLSMAFTNPNAEEHKKAIKLEVGTAVDSLTTGTDNNFFTQGFRVVAKMMADNLLGNALNSLFEYHNYIIFSKGTVNFDGKDHTISYGVFGKVITMNADDMLNAIEKNGNIQIEESSNSSTTPNEEESTESSSKDEVNLENNTASSNSDDFTEVDDNDTHDKSEDTKLEEKANKALDKISKKVSKKVEDKISKKLDEVAQDTSAIEKIIDAVLSFF